MLMRILFVDPPVDYPNNSVNLGCNLGLITVMTYVQTYCNIDVDYYSFEYAKTLGKYSTIEEVLDKKNPDIVCVSVLTHAVPFAKQLSKCAFMRGCIVIWGGIYVTYNAKVLQYSDYKIDYLIVGDGEHSLPYVIKNLISNGISHPTQPVIVECTNDEIPTLNYRIPDFNWIPDELIKKHDLRATIEYTKGCSFRCDFCCVRNTKHINSSKSIKEIELEFINISNHGFRKAIICDNNFLPDWRTFQQIAIIKRNIYPELKLRITLRADLITDSLLDEYVALGVDELIIGVEHVAPLILISMKKTDKPEQWNKIIRKAVTLAAERKILVHPIFMFGWPGENKNTLQLNTETACELGAKEYIEPFISFFTPHPGSTSESHVFNGDILPITSDLSKYIHLYPVSVPTSLGYDAVDMFTDAHNRIRIISGMTYRNPCFTADFVRNYADLIPIK